MDAQDRVRGRDPGREADEGDTGMRGGAVVSRVRARRSMLVLRLSAALPGEAPFWSQEFVQPAVAACCLILDNESAREVIVRCEGWPLGARFHEEGGPRRDRHGAGDRAVAVDSQGSRAQAGRADPQGAGTARRRPGRGGNQLDHPAPLAGESWQAEEAREAGHGAYRDHAAEAG
jgi:hypothetical protein